MSHRPIHRIIAPAALLAAISLASGCAFFAPASSAPESASAKAKTYDWDSPEMVALSEQAREKIRAKLKDRFDRPKPDFAPKQRDDDGLVYSSPNMVTGKAGRSSGGSMALGSSGSSSYESRNVYVNTAGNTYTDYGYRYGGGYYGWGGPFYYRYPGVIVAPYAGPGTPNTPTGKFSGPTSIHSIHPGVFRNAGGRYGRSGGGFNLRYNGGNVKVNIGSN